MASSDHIKSKYFSAGKKSLNAQQIQPSTRSQSETAHNTSAESNADENTTILKKLEHIEAAIKNTVKTEEISELKEAIKGTVKTEELKGIVSMMVKDIMKEQRKEFEHRIEKAEEKSRQERSKLKGEIDDLRVENNNLREMIAAKRSEMEDLRCVAHTAIDTAFEARRSANYNEQYSRKNNVKIYGVRESEGENTGEEVMQLLRDKADTIVHPDEIIAVHRIPGSARDDRPRPIIVKLKNSEVKSRVIKQRSTIKKAKIGVRLADDVTRENTKLMERLNEHEMIESCWFFNGNVFGKIHGSGRKVKFDIDDDIAEKVRKPKKK